MLRIDKWINIGVILGIMCGLLFFFLFLVTFLPVFLWLGYGGWLIAGILGGYGRVRQIMRSIQHSGNEQRGNTSRRKIGRVLMGIGLILAGILVVLGISRLSLHYWWLELLEEPFGGGLVCFGVALIVQGIKPKIKREKMKIWARKAERQTW